MERVDVKSMALEMLHVTSRFVKIETVTTRESI